MKAIRFFPHHLSFSALTACVLSAASLQAQTFSGAMNLTDSPAHLEAAVYPVGSAPATIRLNFNNPTSGQVRIVIRNQKGEIYYEEFESMPKYRRYFNLLGLPAGNYTVELSKMKEHYSQAFVVEPTATKSRIAMVSPSFQPTPDKPTVAKLIVSQ